MVSAEFSPDSRWVVSAADRVVRVWDADSGAVLVDTPFEFPLVVADGGSSTGVMAVEHEWIVPAERAIDDVATGAGPDGCGIAEGLRIQATGAP